jgi:hypothetical protein
MLSGENADLIIYYMKGVMLWSGDC